LRVAKFIKWEITMEKNYHELIPGKIYMGGAADVAAMVMQEGVEVVVDLREESQGCAFEGATELGVVWKKVPLGDNAEQPEAVLFGQAISHVMEAYIAGKKVAFHCGGGKGRTGTVAVGTLYQLGLAKSLDEANEQATAIRPVLKMKADQRHSLELLFESKG
jgi:protein-tyrosine phosphatase